MLISNLEPKESELHMGVLRPGEFRFLWSTIIIMPPLTRTVSHLGFTRPRVKYSLALEETCRKTRAMARRDDHNQVSDAPSVFWHSSG